MSIVAAAVVPHSPVLLPTIAKEHAKLFDKTTTAITNLANDWYAAKPDVVIILSPHGVPSGQEIVLHSAEKYVATFDEYGDMATTITAAGAIGMMHHLHSQAEREHFPLHLQTFERLDYGTSIPLYFLLQAQPKISVCSLLIGTNEPEILLRLAAVLRECTQSDRRRYLIIASADMTRRKIHTPDAHRRPTHEERDFSSSIVAVDAAQLAALVPQPTTCGYGPLLGIVSMLQGIAEYGTIHSFEAPLGVGLLTASFSFSK